MLFLLPVAFTLAAQPLPIPPGDFWSDYLISHSKKNRFILLLRKGEFQGPWLAHEDLLRPRANGELAVTVMEPELALALWQAQGWKESRWVLLGRDGSMLLTGTQAPIPNDVLHEIRRAGWVPMKERRDAFLREHPDHLEARLDAVRESANLALRRAAQLMVGNTPGNQVATLNLEAADSGKASEADLLWAEAAEALRELSEQAQWPLTMGLGSVFEWLRFGGAASSPAIRDRAARLLEGMEGELRRNPSRGDLWKAWSYLAALSPGSHGVGLLESFDPIPGQTWPTSAASQALVAHFRERKDWAGLLQQAEQQLNKPWGERAWTGEAWRKARLDRAQSWGFAKLLALEELKRDEEVAAWREGLRRMTGSAWPILQAKLAEGDGEGTHKAWDDQLALPDPPIPSTPEPLIVKVSAALKGWQHSPEWAFFGPSELKWESGSTPGWTLYSGQIKLASGYEKGELAQTLEQERIPLLLRVEAYQSAHGENLEARQTFVEMLRNRMPNPFLEPILLRTAAKPGVAFRRGSDWEPNIQLWGPAAKRVIPYLELELRRRPSDPDLWRAWADWAPLHPTPLSARALVESIPFFGPREAWAWDLPNSVHLAVISEYRILKRWQPLLDWTQPTFEWVLRQKASSFEELARFQDLLGKPLIQALRALGRAAEIAEVNHRMEGWVSTQRERLRGIQK